METGKIFLTSSLVILITSICTTAMADTHPKRINEKRTKIIICRLGGYALISGQFYGGLTNV